ncbi:MAG: hypothetical protein GX491_18105 [Chloroflexi bacterium]|nr:hypothetical protein [Chloroflexota bacterium]
MSEHVSDWIGAYYDGELPPGKAAEVEAHLEGCAACRRELEELRALSTLLQIDLAGASLESEGRVDAAAGRIMLRLEPVQPQQPRLPAHPRPERGLSWPGALRLLWQMAPLGLFAVWAFSQAVVVVSGGLLVALNQFPRLGELLLPQAQTGLLADILRWLTPSLLIDLGEAIINRLFAPPVVQGGPSSMLAGLGPFAVFELGLLFTLAVFFAGWLASLWAYRQRLSH